MKIARLHLKDGTVLDQEVSDDFDSQHYQIRPWTVDTKNGYYATEGAVFARRPGHDHAAEVIDYDEV